MPEYAMHFRFVASDDAAAIEEAKRMTKQFGSPTYYVSDWHDWAENVNLSCSTCGVRGEEAALHSYGFGARRCVECSEGREVLS